MMLIFRSRYSTIFEVSFFKAAGAVAKIGLNLKSNSQIKLSLSKSQLDMLVLEQSYRPHTELSISFTYLKSFQENVIE